MKKTKTRNNKNIKRRELERQCWSLDIFLIDFMLPRLRVFQENPVGYPPQLTEAGWDDILRRMIKGLELHKADIYWYDENPNKEEDTKLVNGAPILLGKWFYHLWT